MPKPEELTINLEPVPENKTPDHKHTGTDASRVSLKNIDGLIEVVSTVPSSAPNSVYGQIKMYIKSPEASLCLYDYSAKSWKFLNIRI